jgi:hypothetical protein
MEITCFLGIGNIYFHRYDTKGMKTNFENAMALSREIGEVNGEVTAGRGLAFLYLLQKILQKQKNTYLHL